MIRFKFTDFAYWCFTLATIFSNIPTSIAIENELASHGDLNAVGIHGNQSTSELIKDGLDAYIVLDNSGSMRTNDPSFLLKQVVSVFAKELPKNSRLGIVSFDVKASQLLGLTSVVNTDFPVQVKKSLALITYDGQRTDIPAGFEKALYSFRTDERQNSKKIIVVLTDGHVDVGDSKRNDERARWLREELATEAKQRGIQVYAIAFTEDADFELLQSLAQTTNGSYFRVLDLTDVESAFQEIANELMATKLTAETPKSMEAPVIPVDSPIPTAKRTETPESLIGIQWIWVLGGLGVTLVFMFAWLRMRITPPTTSQTPKAKLRPIGNKYDLKEFIIDKSPVKVGRDGSLNDLVITEDTISAEHAKIEFINSSFYLFDLRSSNGTFLNGRKISDHDVTHQVLIKHQDIVAFDKCEFQFLLDEAEKVKANQLSGGTRLRMEPNMAGTVLRTDSNSKTESNEDQTEPGKTSLKPKCPNHPAWDADIQCPVCGHAYCRNCMKTQNDAQMICVNCLKLKD